MLDTDQKKRSESQWEAGVLDHRNRNNAAHQGRKPLDKSSQWGWGCRAVPYWSACLASTTPRVQFQPSDIVVYACNPESPNEREPGKSKPELRLSFSTTNNESTSDSQQIPWAESCPPLPPDSIAEHSFTPGINRSGAKNPDFHLEAMRQRPWPSLEQYKREPAETEGVRENSGTYVKMSRIQLKVTHLVMSSKYLKVN